MQVQLAAHSPGTPPTAVDCRNLGLTGPQVTAPRSPAADLRRSKCCHWVVVRISKKPAADPPEQSICWKRSWPCRATSYRTFGAHPWRTCCIGAVSRLRPEDMRDHCRGDHDRCRRVSPRQLQHTWIAWGGPSRQAYWPRRFNTTCPRFRHNVRKLV